MNISYEVKVEFTKEELKVLKDALNLVDRIRQETHNYDSINYAARQAYDGLSYVIDY